MIGLIVPLVLGIFTGTLTGLIPGIHTNTVFAILTSSAILLSFGTNSLIIFIVATAITHTFLNIIPSIYLGAPDEDSAIGILPLHKFLIKGLGHSATKLTLIGSSLAIVSMIIVIPIFIFGISKIYDTLNQMMAFILIWTIIFLIYFEKEKIKSILILLLAGFLGLATFNLNLNQPMLPLLTGLFGSSSLIHSIKTNSNPPKQEFENLPIEKSEIIKPTLATILVSPICSLLPGLGSSQAAIIAKTIFKKINKEQFLILLGSINTLVMTTSFLTLYLFKKTRTGAAAALSEIVNLSTGNITPMILTVLFSAALSIPLTLLFSKILAKNIHKIPYKKLSIATLIFLTIITFLFCGTIGLLVLAISTIIGLFCIVSGAKRNLLMGSLLIPTIINYLPF